MVSSKMGWSNPPRLQGCPSHRAWIHGLPSFYVNPTNLGKSFKLFPPVASDTFCPGQKTPTTFHILTLS